jgi:hypothetical protein
MRSRKNLPHVFVALPSNPLVENQCNAFRNSLPHRLVAVTFASPIAPYPLQISRGYAAIFCEAGKSNPVGIYIRKWLIVA